MKLRQLNRKIYSVGPKNIPSCIVAPLPLNMTEVQETMKQRFKTPEHYISVSLSSRQFDALIDESVPTGKIVMNTDTYLSLDVDRVVEDSSLVELKVTREILIGDSLTEGSLFFFTNRGRYVFI